MADIEDEILAALEAARDPDVVGEIDLSCSGSGPVRFGDVFSCLSVPRGPSGQLIQSATYTVVVVDDDGTWATHGASGPPNWSGAPSGLNCDQFFDQQLKAADFPPYDTPPGGKYAAENYLYTVAYFFAQDRTALMDVDGNGVPCETVYPSGVVQQVWSGGVVTTRY